MLTCCPLVSSIYKERHLNDTDDPEAVGVSSEDEAEGMEDVLGITRKIQKPVPPPAEPSTEGTVPSTSGKEGIIRV